MNETFILRISDKVNIPSHEIRGITITPNGTPTGGEGRGRADLHVTFEFSKNQNVEESQQKQYFPAKLFPMPAASVEVQKRRSRSSSTLLKCANVTQMLHVFPTEEEMTSSSPKDDFWKSRKEKKRPPTPENTLQTVQDILSAEQSHTEYAVVDFQPWMIDGFLYTLDEKMTSWNTEVEIFILAHPETFFSLQVEKNAVTEAEIDQELPKVPELNEEVESDDDNDWMVHSSDDDEDIEC